MREHLPTLADNIDPNELVLDLSGFEGPIDLLLSLAREKKIDLNAISMSSLADQYLTFIEHVEASDLELAAEYLVMAAWLAYLKSRILLPRDEPLPGGLSGQEMANVLAEQLRRLEQMQQAAKELMSLPRLGRDWLRRGCPEGVSTSRDTVWTADLVSMLRAYGAICAKRTPEPVLTVDPGLLTSVDEALARLERMLGSLPLWQELEAFLPRSLKPGIQSRSALAATFVASLELAKAGRVNIHQEETLGRLMLSPRMENTTVNGDRDRGGNG